MTSGPAEYPARNPILFLLTICAGSFLLFLVQPMIARMALPRLGGAPSVWNSAMLVYQALLLGGYGYAHWLGRFAPRRQAAIHLGLFVLAAMMLPIGLSADNPPANANPFLWVPWLLISSMGPLFLVVAAQAPLMQRWFGLSGGGDPYRLYAASNLGSFGGLIAYPVLVEPMLSVSNQSRLWSAGYLFLLLLVGLCALALPKSLPKPLADEQAAAPTTPRPTQMQVLKWIALAAIPSGLMLSTSLHLTTDIIAMPLIWVLPLGLYLLSFSAAFASNRTLAELSSLAAPFLLLIVAFDTFDDPVSHPIFAAVTSLLCLFAVSVALHGRMFDTRPDPVHLTRFYLSMSVGGMIGGIFCALLAPLIFDWSYEHPILLVISAATIIHIPVFDRVAKLWSGPHRLRLSLWAFTLALFLSLYPTGIFDSILAFSLGSFCLIVLVSLGAASIGNRSLFAAILALLMLCAGGWEQLVQSWRTGQMTRSYFGIYAIGTETGVKRILAHGTTVHGIQLLAPGQEKVPTTYYGAQSGVGLAMAAAPKLFGDHARIDVVGLGAGTLSCYARPGQDWHYYEIDPAVAAIARDTSKFTFLSRCLPGAKIIIGDARLELARAKPAGADLLAIDAFSSDSVPMHLLTQEAFQTYRRRLTPNGLLLVHISNRFIDLRPVVAAAAQNGWTARLTRYTVDEAGMKLAYSGSIWVALSPKAETIAKLEQSSGAVKWRPLLAKPGFSAWTDNFGSILPLLLFSGKYSED
jgi:spermidine synthase